MFRNNKKTAENHPDYNVKIHMDQDVINGLQSQINEGKDLAILYGGAWVKQSDGAGTFISGKVNLPQERTQQATPEAVEDMMKPTPVKTFVEPIDPSQDDLPF